jgi:hypothetical protein
MIDWYGVFRNALWIAGLAVILAAVSYADWRRGFQSPKGRMRAALGRPGFLAAFSIGMVLFCTGLALSSNAWWEIAAWALLGLLFAWQGVVAWWRSRHSVNKD